MNRYEASGRLEELPLLVVESGHEKRIRGVHTRGRRRPTPLSLTAVLHTLQFPSSSSVTNSAFWLVL